MKIGTIAPVALVAFALAGCAQTMALTGNADQQCGALARADDMRVNEVLKSENVAGTQNVQMRLEDTLGRRFTATCVHTAANGARWASPLPSNAARR